MAEISTVPIQNRTAHSIAEKERTSDVLTEENSKVDFASMFLSDSVTAGLHRVGFEKPSPIQLKAIPLGRCGLDLIVQAKSGTGKTCVFTVIALESLDLTSPTTQVLILAPTREIAVQIQETFQAIGCEMKGLRCHVFIGGTLFGPDRQKLKKCHVAVGTPGRIKQLIEYDVLKTGSIRLFVLDEADKLLEEDFQEQINWIYNSLPDNKQMLALSATYPEYLAKHLTKYMREPTFVRLNPKDLTLKGIKQLYVELPGHALPNKAFEIKVVKLLEILTQVSFNQCLIFSNLQTRAQNLCDILCDRGWPSECISGSQEQAQRLSAMSKLKKFQCRILISTDLTARGIDAENVNLIINLDIPTDTKTYLHRIGRAGRFGTHGAAISLACRGRDVDLLRNIQRHCRIQMTDLPDPAPSDLLKQDFGGNAVYEGNDNTAIQPDPDVQRLDHLVMNIYRNNKESEISGGESTTSPIEESGETNNVSGEASEVSGRLEDEKQSVDVSRKCKEQMTYFPKKDSSISDNRSKGVSLTKDGSVGKSKKCRVTQTKLAAKRGSKCIMVDTGVQTDMAVPEELLQCTVNMQGSQNFGHSEQRKPVLPLGFEDYSDILKLHLPLLSRCKDRGENRNAWSWQEARKSFEEFTNSKSGRIKKSRGETIGNGEIVMSVSSVELPVPSSLELGEEALMGHPEYPSTPLKDIQLYRALMVDALHQGGRTSQEIPREILQGIDRSEEADGKEKHNPDKIPSQNSLPIPSPEKATINDSIDIKNDKALVQRKDIRTNGLSCTSSKPELSVAPGKNLKLENSPFYMDEAIDSGGSQESVQTQSDQSSVFERKDRDEVRSNVVKESKGNTKDSAKVFPVRKGKQKIKEHVFTRSTLGALMSHEELNIVIKKPQKKLFSKDKDDDGNTPQVLPEAATSILSSNMNGEDTNHLSKMEPTDENLLSSNVVQKSESNTKQQNTKPEHKKSGKSSDDASDPVWAIFRGYINRKPTRDEKKASGQEDSTSPDSSSSFCESDTSTASEENKNDEKDLQSNSNGVGEDSSSSFFESDTTTTSEDGEHDGEEEEHEESEEAEEEEEEVDYEQDEAPLGIEPILCSGESYLGVTNGYGHHPSKTRGPQPFTQISQTHSRLLPEYTTEGGWQEYAPYVGVQPQEHGAYVGSTSVWNPQYGSYSHNEDPSGWGQVDTGRYSGAQDRGDQYSGWHSAYHDVLQYGAGTGETGVPGHWYPGVYRGCDYNMHHDGYGPHGQTSYPYTHYDQYY